MTLMDNRTWTLADRLRRARLMAGLEQAELATLIGVSRASISGYERGRNEPNASTFVRWARATGADLEWLATAVLPDLDSNQEPAGYRRSAWAVAA